MFEQPDAMTDEAELVPAESEAGQVSALQPVLDAVIEPSADRAPELEVSDRTFRGRLRRLIWPDAKERGEQAAHRLRMLSYAIEYAPDSPTNYVLRGELYLETGAADLAHDDFKRALGLATDQLEKSDWGLVAQAMQDRAEAGLAAAEKRMQARPS